MSYTLDAITSATPATDLMATVKPLLIAAGFTFVETYKSTAGTLNPTADVYKSPSASNSLGQDWYLLIKRGSDTAAYLQMTVAEAYDISTHLVTNYARGNYVASGAPPSVTPTVGTYLYGSATAYKPDAGVASGNGFDGLWQNPSSGTYISTPTSSSFTWALSATVDRVILGTRSSTGETTEYTGSFDSVLPSGTAGDVPLGTFWLNYPGSNANLQASGAYTREPLQTVSSVDNFMGGIYANTSTALTYTPLTTGGALYGNPYTVARVPIFSSRVGTPSSSALGNGMRGLLKDSLQSFVLGVLGDTITYNGKTYAKIGNGGTSLLSPSWSIFVDTSV